MEGLAQSLFKFWTASHLANSCSISGNGDGPWNFTCPGGIVYTALSARPWDLAEESCAGELKGMRLARFDREEKFKDIMKIAGAGVAQKLLTEEHQLD